MNSLWQLKSTAIFGGWEESLLTWNTTCSYKLKHHFKAAITTLQQFFFLLFCFFPSELDPFLYNARWFEFGGGSKEETKSKISSSKFLSKKSLLNFSFKYNVTLSTWYKTYTLTSLSFSHNIIQMKIKKQFPFQTKLVTLVYFGFWLTFFASGFYTRVIWWGSQPDLNLWRGKEYFKTNQPQKSPKQTNPKQTQVWCKEDIRFSFLEKSFPGFPSTSQ